MHRLSDQLSNQTACPNWPDLFFRKTKLNSFRESNLSSQLRSPFVKDVTHFEGPVKESTVASCHPLASSWVALLSTASAPVRHSNLVCCTVKTHTFENSALSVAAEGLIRKGQTRVYFLKDASFHFNEKSHWRWSGSCFMNIFSRLWYGKWAAVLFSSNTCVGYSRRLVLIQKKLGWSPLCLFAEPFQLR